MTSDLNSAARRICEDADSKQQIPDPTLVLHMGFSQSYSFATNKAARVQLNESFRNLCSNHLKLDVPSNPVNGHAIAQ